MSPERDEPLGISRTLYERFCDAIMVRPNYDLTPVERAATIPSWLCAELIATPSACEKLQSWSMAPPTDTLTAERARVRMEAHGDTALPDFAARMLAEKLPRVVADYALARVSFVFVGLIWFGWCGCPVRTKKPVQITVGATRDARGPEQFDRVLAHEIAHAWLNPEPPPDVQPWSSFECDTALYLENIPAESREFVERVRTQHRGDETIAIALAAAWGYPEPFAD